MNKNRNTNNIYIILNTNKAQFIVDKLSICTAVGYEINLNLDFIFCIFIIILILIT